MVAVEEAGYSHIRKNLGGCDNAGRGVRTSTFPVNDNLFHISMSVPCQ